MTIIGRSWEDFRAWWHEFLTSFQLSAVSCQLCLPPLTRSGPSLAANQWSRLRRCACAEPPGGCRSLTADVGPWVNPPKAERPLPMQPWKGVSHVLPLAAADG